MLKAVLYISSCFVISLGFMFDDPCYVTPRIYGIPDSEDFTVNVTVPEKCRNGTFDWDYPRGHVLLIFPRNQTVQTSVCIRDSLGGDVFTFTDITSNMQLGEFNHTRWACTDKSNAREIVLRVDAPPELRYMGAVLYRTQT